MRTFCFSLFSYALLLFTIAKLPDKMWDYLLELSLILPKKLKSHRKNLPLIAEIDRGQELLANFSKCEAQISLGAKILPDFLPKYKFYTELLEQLFFFNRNLGIKIKKFFPEIRKGLINDLQFEKKVLDEVMAAILQFLVIALTTWSFVFLSSLIAQISLSKSISLLMILLQIMGIVIFFFILKKIKKNMFVKFNKSIEELYLFNSFLEIGLPINEIISRSKICDGSIVSFKIFENLSDRVKKLIIRLKETGLSPRDEVQEIIGEIWHLQGEYFKKFTKIVQILKFSILIFFFLPAYFLYLYSIFKFFMEQ